MKQILSILFAAVLIFNSYLAWLIFDLKKQTDNVLNNFGATIPTVVALFETSLQSSITSTAASATLVKGTDKEGTSLTGTIGFVIDEGTADEEFITCSASGTALTSCTRGISVTQPASSSAALKKSHRRGASIKITNYPQLAILSRILNAQSSVPNTLYYPSAVSLSTASSSVLVHKNYVDNVATAGAPDATLTVKGLSELATVAEINAGTGLGGTSARLFINPSYLASSNYSTFLPTTKQKDALSGSLGTPSTTNKYITEQDIASASFVTTASRSDWIIRSDGDSVPSGLWIDITKLNITASASGDLIYRSASAFTRLAIKGGVAEELLVASGGFPIWASISNVSGFSPRIGGITANQTLNNASGTLATVSVPGGKITSDGSLMIEAWWDTGGTTVDDTFRIEFAGTTLLQILRNGNELEGNNLIYMKCIVQNRNSESSQSFFCYSNNDMSGATDVIENNAGTSTFNTAISQDVTFEGTSAGAYNITLLYANVWVIP